jgi:hypothetical protein
LLSFENLALRQRLAMVSDRNQKRLQFCRRAELFAVLLYRFWPGCLQTLQVFQPDRWCAGIAKDVGATGAGNRVVAETDDRPLLLPMRWFIWIICQTHRSLISQHAIVSYRRQMHAVFQTNQNILTCDTVIHSYHFPGRRTPNNRLINNDSQYDTERCALDCSGKAIDYGNTGFTKSGLLWQADRIKRYMDDVLVHRVLETEVSSCIVDTKNTGKLYGVDVYNEKGLVARSRDLFFFGSLHCR